MTTETKKTKKTRKTLEQQLLDAKARLDKIEEKIKNKKIDINKDSPGITELVEKIKTAADDNKVKVADIIKAVSKITRAGLQITDTPRKPRTKKSKVANVESV